MRRIARLLGVAVLIGIIYKEARKGPEDERWHGKSLGFVPYDLRPPSLARIRETYWNPDDPILFPGRVAGIGWGINFAALANKLRRL
jgi:hypothetical protein